MTKKKSLKRKPKPAPKLPEPQDADEQLRQGVERAKRGLRGEDPDLRKKP